MRTFYLLILLFLGTGLTAQERFIRWHTDLSPQPDRSVEVTETITVAVEGDKIKRGIFRDLPLDNQRPVEVISVLLDGKEEAYHTENRSRLKRLYVGRREVLLEPGSYTYTLRYRYANAIDRLEGVDELYFNLVGDGVEFPIEALSATLTIPDGAEITQYACYTGERGSTAHNCTMTSPAEGNINYVATQRLSPGEALTVAAGFALGYFIDPPEGIAKDAAGTRDPARSYLQRKGTVLIVFLGLFAGLFYAWDSWQKHGVDPPTPEIRQQYDPPNGLSPASIGYLRSGAGGAGAFTASLVGLATRGFLTIEPEEKEGFLGLGSTVVYHLRTTEQKPTAEELPVEQYILYGKLFANSDDVKLDASYDSKLRKVVAAHDKELSRQHKDFIRQGNNLVRILPLVGILLVMSVIAAILLKTDDTGYGIGVFVVGIVLMVALLITYGFLIPQPSPEKVKLRAQIKAFREYLGLSEEKRKRLLNAPQMSAEYYEALLPYAIALGINKKWSSYFDELISAQRHQPAWMIGTMAFSPNHFQQHFQSTVSSTSTPPSSSSASGGGGSVGGGVGGGGAGGW